MVFPEGGGGGKGEGSKIPGNMAREGTLVARQDKCVAACCQNGCGQEKGGAGGLVERGEWQIIGWVHNMQFGHARVSEKLERVVLKCALKISLAIHGITKVKHLTNSRKRDPGTSSNIKALGKITLEIKKWQIQKKLSSIK